MPLCPYINLTNRAPAQITDRHGVIFDTIMWYTPPVAAWDDKWKTNVTSNMHKSCVSGTMGFPLYAEYWSAPFGGGKPLTPDGSRWFVGLVETAGAFLAGLGTYYSLTGQASNADMSFYGSSMALFLIRWFLRQTILRVDPPPHRRDSEGVFICQYKNFGEAEGMMRLSATVCLLTVCIHAHRVGSHRLSIAFMVAAVAVFIAEGALPQPQTKNSYQYHMSTKGYTLYTSDEVKEMGAVARKDDWWAFGGAATNKEL